MTSKASQLSFIAPKPTPDDQFFWDGVAQHRLLLRRCSACDFLQHPPTPMCPRCGGLEWTVGEARGTGTVVTWMVARHPTSQHSSEPEDAGRIVSIIDLAEGIRFVSNLVDVDVADVYFGMPVRVTFVEYENGTLPQFAPAAGAVAPVQGSL